MSNPTETSCLPESVLRILGRLASEPYQLRWIVNGSASEYVLASDLIGSVEQVAKWAASANTMPAVLSVIHHFLARYYECLEKMPHSIDVQSDAAWADLRRAAAKALADLGHSIPDDIED